MARSFGTTSIAERTGLNRLADGKVGLLSTWVRLNAAGDGTNRVIFGNINSSDQSRFFLRLASDNNIEIEGRNSANTLILRMHSTAAYTSANGWLHIGASWDLAAGTGRLHVNRTQNQDAGQNLFTDDEIDYTNGSWSAGALRLNAGGLSQSLQGRMYDLAFWQTYLDLSVAANIRNIISSDGLTDYANPGPTSGTPKPVAYADVGTDPIILLSGGFVPNRGTGGNFSLVNVTEVQDNPAAYRQSALYPTPGERWFDSEASGFSYPRSRTFVERREGVSRHGLRMGLDEKDETTRNEMPGQSFQQLVLQDHEEDVEEFDR